MVIQQQYGTTNLDKVTKVTMAFINKATAIPERKAPNAECEELPEPIPQSLHLIQLTLKHNRGNKPQRPWQASWTEHRGGGGSHPQIGQADQGQSQCVHAQQLVTQIEKIPNGLNTLMLTITDVKVLG